MWGGQLNGTKHGKQGKWRRTGLIMGGGRNLETVQQSIRKAVFQNPLLHLKEEKWQPRTKAVMRENTFQVSPIIDNNPKQNGTKSWGGGGGNEMEGQSKWEHF